MRTMICGFLAVTLLTLTAAADDARLLSVSGEALIRVVPDEVVIGIGVETFDPLLDNAKTQNDESTRRLLRAIAELGIEDKHVQTDTLELELKYHDSSHPSEGIEGYFARRLFTVTLKDVGQFEKTIDTALKRGANRLMGFEYRTTDLRKYRDEARRKALRAAREKAELLAGELGARVGKPRTISEGYYGYSGPTRWWGGWGGANVAQNAYQQQREGSNSGETLPLGQIGVNAGVSVTFDLDV